MKSVIIEADVAESVAIALMQITADEKAHLRRVISAAVVRFVEEARPAMSLHTPDSWDSFLLQSHDVAVPGLPQDFSTHHDHYLHRAPGHGNAP